MPAIWQIHQPMRRAVWKLRVLCDVVRASCSTEFRSCRILRMLIYFLGSFSHRILHFRRSNPRLSTPPSSDSSSPLLSLLLLQKSDNPQFSFLWYVSRGVPAAPPRTLNRFGCYSVTQLLLHAEGKTVRWPWVASHCNIVAPGCRSRSLRISADERLISPSLWEASSWSISLGVAGEQLRQETFLFVFFALLPFSSITQWMHQVRARMLLGSQNMLWKYARR